MLPPEIAKAVIRWAVFIIGIGTSASFVIMFFFLPKEFNKALGDNRFLRINGIVQAGLGVHMAVGAWLAHPIGWYAALIVSILNPVEAIIRHRWILSGGRDAVRGTVVVQVFLLLLLALLLTPAGREAFGMRRDRDLAQAPSAAAARTAALANEGLLQSGANLAYLSLPWQVPWWTSLTHGAARRAVARCRTQGRYAAI